MLGKGEILRLRGWISRLSSLVIWWGVFTERSSGWSWRSIIGPAPSRSPHSLSILLAHSTCTGVGKLWSKRSFVRWGRSQTDFSGVFHPDACCVKGAVLSADTSDGAVPLGTFRQNVTFCRNFYCLEVKHHRCQGGRRHFSESDETQDILCDLV